MNNIKGFLYGILSSASFGLIPLFTLPLMTRGMVFDSILLYRFITAATAIGIILIVRKESFRISRADFLTILLLSILYDGSGLFLLWGYDYVSSGIATTIHFLYPVFVTLTMILFFREHGSAITIVAILLAITGVWLLSQGEGGEVHLSLKGIVILLISAICYALYIVGVNKSRIRNMSGLKLTFYVLSTGAALFFINALIKGGIQPVPDRTAAINILLLALVPTVVSNLSLVQAVKRIGSTLTSVLGAMEPLTAVCVGIVAFGEPFNGIQAIGFAGIILSVSLIILARPLERQIHRLKTRMLIARLRKLKRPKQTDNRAGN